MRANEQFAQNIQHLFSFFGGIDLKQILKIEYLEDRAALALNDIIDFTNIQNTLYNQIGTAVSDIQELVVCGGDINDFTFLKEMTALKNCRFFPVKASYGAT